MTLEPGRKYVITNVKSGTALDLSGSDDVSVTGWEYHRGANQQWYLVQDGGQWALRNAHEDKYLGLQYRAEDGVPVCGVEGRVLWNIDSNGQYSVYRISVPETLFNIDLSDHGNPKNGTPVTVWGKHPGQNQTWKFEEA